MDSGTCVAAPELPAELRDVADELAQTSARLAEARRHERRLEESRREPLDVGDLVSDAVAALDPVAQAGGVRPTACAARWCACARTRANCPGS